MAGFYFGVEQAAKADLEHEQFEHTIELGDLQCVAGKPEDRPVYVARRAALRQRLAEIEVALARR
jgi:hypothetical protein